MVKVQHNRIVRLTLCPARKIGVPVHQNGRIRAKIHPHWAVRCGTPLSLSKKDKAGRRWEYTTAGMKCR